MIHIAAHPCFAALPMDNGHQYFVRSRIIVAMANDNKMFLTCEMVGHIMTHQAEALLFILPQGRA